MTEENQNSASMFSTHVPSKESGFEEDPPPFFMLAGQWSVIAASLIAYALLNLPWPEYAAVLDPILLTGSVAYGSVRNGRKSGILSAFIALLFMFAVFPQNSLDGIGSEIVLAAAVVLSSIVFSGFFRLASDDTAIDAEERNENVQGRAVLYTNIRTQDFMDMSRREIAPRLERLERYAFALRSQAQKISDARIISLARRLEAEYYRLDHLMQRLWQFARIDFESMPRKVEAFDIFKVVREAVEYMAAARPDYQIVFILHTSDGGLAAGDRFRIRKVIDHLLKNGVRYSPPGSRIIATLSESGPMFAVSIRDFGAGIDPEKLELMRAAFSAAQWERKPGFGIGLYTAHEIIRRSGGTVSIKSKKSKGTEISFTVPKSDIV